MNLTEQISNLLYNDVYKEGTETDVFKYYEKDMDLITFRQIASADPSSVINEDGFVKKVGKYTKWLLKLFKNNNFKIEDSYKALSYLEAFMLNYKKLDKKDINQYKSLPDLYEAVANYLPNEEGNIDKEFRTKGQQKKAVKSAADDIEVFAEDQYWKIIIPLTEEASCYWGKDTQWCTASQTNNYFDYYNSRGKLYILFDKYDGDKYQFHFEEEQFMNIYDREIDLSNFYENNKNSDAIKKLFDEKLKSINQIINEYNNKGISPKRKWSSEDGGYVIVKDDNGNTVMEQKYGIEIEGNNLKFYGKDIDQILNMRRTYENKLEVLKYALNFESHNYIYYDYNQSMSEILSYLDIDDKNIDMIKKYLDIKYPIWQKNYEDMSDNDAVIEWIENKADDISDEEITNAIRNAISMGNESATISKMYKDANDFLEEYNIKVDWNLGEPGYTWYVNMKDNIVFYFRLYGGIYEAFEEGNEHNEYFIDEDLNEPYYGWNVTVNDEDFNELLYQELLEFDLETIQERKDDELGIQRLPFVENIIV